MSSSRGCQRSGSSAPGSPAGPRRVAASLWWARLHRGSLCVVLIEGQCHFVALPFVVGKRFLQGSPLRPSCIDGLGDKFHITEGIGDALRCVGVLVIARVAGESPPVGANGSLQSTRSTMKTMGIRIFRRRMAKRVGEKLHNISAFFNRLLNYAKIWSPSSSFAWGKMVNLALPKLTIFYNKYQ